MAEPTPEERAAAQAYARANIKLDTAPLQAALAQAYSDGTQLGSLSGAEQTGVTGPDVPTDWSAFWDGWAPGNAPAAQVASEGLSGLISGIADTTLDQFGSIIAQGIADGTGIDDIAAQLGDYLNDPNRAFTIANTEVAGAVTQASIQQFAAQGVNQFDLITSPEACDDCVAIEAANPHPLDDADSQPPIHPNCRCAAAPIDPGSG